MLSRLLGASTVALAALCLSGTAAWAAPADSPAVVTQAAGAALSAYDQDDEVCVQLDVKLGRTHASGSQCAAVPGAPTSGRAPLVAAAAGWVAAAVPAEATHVELFDGRRAAPMTAETVGPGRYAGAAASRVRFVLVHVAEVKRLDDEAGDPYDRPGPYALRALGADGSLVSLYDDSRLRPPEAGPLTLARSAAKGASITVTGTRTTRLAPVPGAPERRAPQLCLGLSTDAEVGGGADSVCLPTDRPVSIPLTLSVCGGRGALALAELLAPGEDAARLVLTDGRTAPATVTALPDALGTAARLAVAVVRGDVGVRRFEATGGGATRSQEVAAPPPTSGCGSGFVPSFAGPFPAGPAQPLAGPAVVGAQTGEHTLLVVDAADGPLCSAVDAMPATSDACETPTDAPFDTAVSATPDGRAIGGSVPAAVATVEVVGADGASVSVPTGAGAYAGAWAAQRRFWVAAAPSAAPVLGVRLLDADGHLLGVALAQYDAPLALTEPEVLGALPGGLRAVRARGQQLGFEGAKATTPVTVLCVIGRQAPLPTDSQGCFGGERFSFGGPFVEGSVDCATHRMVLTASVSRGARLVARTAGGRLRRGRTFDGTVAIVVLEPGDELRGAEVRQGKTRFTAGDLRFPAARAQCGYGLGFITSTPALTLPVPVAP